MQAKRAAKQKRRRVIFQLIAMVIRVGFLLPIYY
jgi:hypothetical protein